MMILSRVATIASVTTPPAQSPTNQPRRARKEEEGAGEAGIVITPLAKWQADLK